MGIGTKVVVGLAMVGLLFLGVYGPYLSKTSRVAAPESGDRWTIDRFALPGERTDGDRYTVVHIDAVHDDALSLSYCGFTAPGTIRARLGCRSFGQNPEADAAAEVRSYKDANAIVDVARDGDKLRIFGCVGGALAIFVFAVFVATRKPRRPTGSMIS